MIAIKSLISLHLHAVGLLLLAWMPICIEYVNHWWCIRLLTYCWLSDYWKLKVLLTTIRYITAHSYCRRLRLLLYLYWWQWWLCNLLPLSKLNSRNGFDHFSQKFCSLCRCRRPHLYFRKLQIFICFCHLLKLFQLLGLGCLRQVWGRLGVCYIQSSILALHNDLIIMADWLFLSTISNLLMNQKLISWCWWTQHYLFSCSWAADCYLPWVLKGRLKTWWWNVALVRLDDISCKVHLLISNINWLVLLNPLSLSLRLFIFKDFLSLL
jgi:hypothetical protein